MASFSLRQQQEKFQQQQARLLKSAQAQGPLPAKPKPPAQPTPAPPRRAQKRPNAAIDLNSQSVPANPMKNYSFIADGEKLLHIEQIRNGPKFLQVKRVVEVLLEKKPGRLTAEQINELCYIDLANKPEIFEAVKNNVKVEYDGGYFAYKAKHDLQNKDELLRLIRKLPEGISMSELKDSYQTVESDVQELKSAGDIWIIQNTDTLEDILYPNDPRAQIRLDLEIRDIVMSVEIPRDFVDVEKELQKAGMKPATNSAKRRELAGMVRQDDKPKKKQKRASRQTKYTNVHLMELFENPVPEKAKDERKR